MISVTGAIFIMSVAFPTKGHSPQGFGQPKITHFFDGAVAAISLQFDDSMTSQLANALPLLNARGLRGTFFVNTESGQYKSHRQEWESEVLKAGHELGNHTSHHKGARTIEDVTREIGDCSDHLAKVFGPKPRLVSFATPGGVPWDFSSAQLAPIFAKYHLILATDRNFFDEQKTDPISFVQRAIDSQSWSNVSMHGTGGEWFSTSIPVFTKLLDFLVAHRPKLWVAPNIEIYKYVHEREAAELPVLTSKDDRSFSISVTCDPGKLSTYGLPIPTLYDQPLTIEVPIPATWQSFQVTQGKSQARYSVQVRADSHVARFNLLPNFGEATVVQVAK